MSPLVARRGTIQSKTPAPAGLHQAVCVDVQDLGVQESQWGSKHKVRLIWQIADVDPATGRRYELARKFTLSLHERAALRTVLESWRGKKFTDTELDGFDLERLLGVNGQVHAAHEVGADGNTYANVTLVLPPAKGAAKLQPEQFTRLQDRGAGAGVKR